MRRPLTAVTGRGIGLALTAVSNLRPAEKPMHPIGTVGLATLQRRGSAGGPGSGAAFLDEAGSDEVLVRASRSLGLPPPYPDVPGLAIRVPTPDGRHADLLLAGTGRSALTRYAFLPSTSGGSFLSTVLPYDAPCGSVQIGAEAREDGVWELVWATLLGSWTPFATLALLPGPEHDASVSFDATAAAPAGLAVPEWHRRLREPSYRAARRSRESAG
jgi:hypothetical protein